MGEWEQEIRLSKIFQYLYTYAIWIWESLADKRERKCSASGKETAKLWWLHYADKRLHELESSFPGFDSQRSKTSENKQIWTFF